MIALVDADTEIERHCRICQETKPLDAFYKDKSGRNGRGYYCKPCANLRAKETYHKINKGTVKHRKQQKNSYTLRKYGITLEEYEARLAAQHYECAICSTPLSLIGQLTHLDHNHTTGKLRQFLCTNCNRGLGHFKDSQTILMNAVQYLKTHFQE